MCAQVERDDRLFNRGKYLEEINVFSGSIYKTAFAKTVQFKNIFKKIAINYRWDVYD